MSAERRKTVAPGKAEIAKLGPSGPASFGRGLPNGILGLLRTVGNRAVRGALTAHVPRSDGPSERLPLDGRGVAGERPVEVAERGTADSAEPYPFREQIQRGFGHHDIGNVRAHTGSHAAAAARALGARAFTFGDRVAFDGAPDLHTAAHEAAHVVQQRAGALAHGKGSDALERHADVVADRIVQGRPAATLLDAMAPGRRSRAVAVQHRAVQRVPVKTKYGEFDTTKYDPLPPGAAAGAEIGVDIVLTFEPGANVDAKKIGLTQSVRSVLGGNAVAIHPAMHKRMVPSGNTGEGRQIDRSTLGAYANPLYATGVPGAKDKLEDTPTVPGWGQHGWHYTDKGKPKKQKAILKDQPSLGGHAKNSEQVFETAALAVEGAQSGTYMGSVEWGWKIDGAGTFTKLKLKLIKDAVPSAEFMAAAKQWNKWTTRGTIKTTPDPTNVYDATYSLAFTVAKDTVVTVSDGYVHTDVHYNVVTIQSGKETGKTGRIKTNDMRDAGGGRATIDLPIQRESTIKAATPGGQVNVRGAGAGSAPVVATLPNGARVIVLNETGRWVQVQVDSTQAGVALHGVAPDLAGMLKGFVSKELIK
jgi:hypothetical protein